MEDIQSFVRNTYQGTDKVRFPSQQEQEGDLSHSQPGRSNTQRSVMLGSRDIVICEFKTHQESEISQKKYYDSQRREFEP
jgi:hypothetical protein